MPSITSSLRLSTKPSVTAGLMWQPDTWPIVYAIASSASPNANATPYAPILSAARMALPGPTIMSTAVPVASAMYGRTLIAAPRGVDEAEEADIGASFRWWPERRTAPHARGVAQAHRQRTGGRHRLRRRSLRSATLPDSPLSARPVADDHATSSVPTSTPTATANMETMAANRSSAPLAPPSVASCVSPIRLSDPGTSSQKPGRNDACCGIAEGRRDTQNATGVMTSAPTNALT